ncbi:cyanophycin synthetase [Longimicrobium terrae]|uniref:Cyanophycin synthetase n=1 Tax=Longimicrobium terrae TaxID=1639882 RepID=A0A841GZS1_9BACT|nr:cyanophycin synthetase [Longimicrobium terrae]MBB4636754.1 cyanophycin synthetase [Longimicrobium terrae]MBB6071247.1 cyanophycin synthetase [Longimicrobium terrae]NNC29293.1 cyanophycin synthetase [Longimicrobium terrae]
MSQAMSEPTAPAAQFDPEQLRVSRLRAVRGPNFWRLAPVIACDLTLGSLEDVPTSEIPGFNDRLLAAMPTLHEHPCSRGTEGGFVERLRAGTHLPHVLEHVALEMQTLAGTDVSFGRVVESGDPGVWWLIVAYEEEEVGLQAVRDAVKLVRACMTGAEFPIQKVTEDLHDLLENTRLGPSTGAIVEEARRRAIPVRRLNSHSLVQLGLGINLRRVQAAMSDYTSAIGVEIAQDKDDTRRVLGAIGLPVPEGGVASTLDGILETAHDIGWPVLIKPLDASHGRGISGRLENDEQIAAAFEVARTYSRRVVIEQFVTGRDYRVLVVDGKLAAVAERVPAHVVGDGTSSVAELITIANRDPRRGSGHSRTLTHLPADKATETYLASCGLSLAHVPAPGETVFLRATANLSTGGTSIDRTDEIHPDNITACEMAAGVVGLDIAGIDVLSPDISVPFRENGAVIIEVNAAPGLRMHTHPSEGQGRQVGAPIIDMLYPPGSPYTIPVIAITGTNGKTTTTRLTAHLFRQTGKTVGFTTTDGVYLQNRMVMEGDMTGPFSANIILSNPTVEVAVLETARGGVIRAGLGFDECDVGVVLNVSADHLGLRGINTVEQLAEVKSVVPAVVKREGHAVLNADDPLVYAMRDRSGGDIVLFSTMAAGENALFDDHIERGGIGARIENDEFVIRRGRLRIPIASVREVPLMMGGAARFQQQNVLAAICTAYVQGVRYDTIRAGLLSFFPSPSMTPGRLNMVRLGDVRVLIDYAHNPAAVEGLVEMVNELPARMRVGVIGAPGDRRDDDIRELGRLCSGLDRVFVKEDKDLRGREPRESALLMIEGLREGGMAEDAIEIVLDEYDAVDRALSVVDAGDLVMMLADKVEGVLKHVQRRQGTA